ncbi:MAG: prephenate dehydratase [Mariprofundaceae bacterium]|nr:prephenate dehydratase [Mariprofundaceae bacterium]
MNHKKKLQDLRTNIDDIDNQILELIEKRVSFAHEVGHVKEDQGYDGPFYVPSREASIIRRLHSRSQNVLPQAALHGIFREIIGACLALEKNLSIAYLGPEGTFTHAAAVRQFGSSVRYHPTRTIDDVFDEVEAGRVSYGVVPIENTLGGAVTHTLDCFVERDAMICAEIQLQIKHHLLTQSANLSGIKKVISHPQPLAQCRKWLQDNLAHAELISADSTAQAAEIAATDPSCAAIASLAVAEKLQLPILAANIEDSEDNITRFLVIGQHDAQPSGEDVTALMLSAPDQAGTLHALLSPFAKRDIELSSIESRPSQKKLWEYVFFMNLRGHHQDDHIKAALSEVQSTSGSYLKILGSYPVSRLL